MAEHCLGIVRTLKVSAGIPLGLEQHVRHFFRDVDKTGYAPPSKDFVIQQVRNCAKPVNALGVLRLSAHWQTQHEMPMLACTVRTYTPWPTAAKVATYQFTDNVRSPVPGAKLSSRQDYMAASTLIGASGVDEVLLFNRDDCVIEGCISNVVCYLAGRWQTPSLEHFGVQGLARETVISCIQTQGDSIQFNDNLQRNQLLTADGVWLINAVRGVVPVGMIDGHQLNIDWERTRQIALWLKVFTG